MRILQNFQKQKLAEDRREERYIFEIQVPVLKSIRETCVHYILISEPSSYIILCLIIIKIQNL